jgi:protein TonB
VVQARVMGGGMVNRIRVEVNVMQASLIHQNPPNYPTDSKTAGIAGAVILSVLVGKDGAVKDASFREGQSTLSQAAIDAVRTWTYKPTLINGQAVEVLTDVTVNFPLQ